MAWYWWLAHGAAVLVLLNMLLFGQRLGVLAVVRRPALHQQEPSASWRGLFYARPGNGLRDLTWNGSRLEAVAGAFPALGRYLSPPTRKPHHGAS
jgi:hypothetical protein